MSDFEAPFKRVDRPQKAKQLDQIVPLSDARAADINEEVKKLRKDVDDHHGEQKQIIIGVVVATAIALLLVAVGVAVQLFVFNSMFKDSLDKVQESHFQDYKKLQDELNQTKDALHQEIITQLKPNSQ
jgi:hypothetical protein